MKTLKFINILLLLTFFFVLWACEDNIFDNPVDTSVALTIPRSLSVEFLADTAVTVSWKYYSSGKYLFVVELSEDNKTFTKLGEAAKSNSLTANKAFLVGKKYYFRVNATGDMNKSGYASAEAVLTGLDAPTQLAATFQNDTTAVLTWVVNSLFETGFVIELSPNDNSHFEIIDTVTTYFDTLNSNTANIYANFQKGETYFFRLRAISKNNSSAYSNIASNGIKPEVPTLLSPIDGTTEQTLTPTLSWNASSGATSYSLQVSTNISFTSFIYNQSNLTSTTQQVTGLAPLTNYYWRVSATNSYGISDYSNIWNFTTTISAPLSPTLILPANGAINQSLTPTLSWNASSTAISYTFQVSTNSSFSSYVYNQSALTGTEQQVPGLLPSTTYHWRVSAANSIGNSQFSTVWSFSTRSFQCGVEDVNYSGKIYHTVQIGAQCWLKENLDVGTMIQGTANPSNNSTIEKYCYDNNTANCTTYGGLYQWNEAMAYTTTVGAQGICPTGWHIPSESDFRTLLSEVNNDGNSLKAVGQGTGNGAGTNTSGFSALFAGYRYNNFYFFNIGNFTAFWISSEAPSPSASFMDLYGSGSGYSFSSNDKDYGYSIRCIKDY